MTPQSLLDLARELPGFRGDLGWIHSLEGHYGKGAYWPGGQSGVTLDPGVDLGYVGWDVFMHAYSHLLSSEQIAACRSVRGTTGRAARAAIRSSRPLRLIRISREQAAEIFPVVARRYWTALCKRFRTLDADSTPPAVQTAFLSLGYNRGAYNKDLDVLAQPFAAQDWNEVADRIEAMQDDHPLEGIRQRRDREAAFIRSGIEDDGPSELHSNQLVVIARLVRTRPADLTTV